jgi:hypothetical protein
MIARRTAGYRRPDRQEAQTFECLRDGISVASECLASGAAVAALTLDAGRTRRFKKWPLRYQKDKPDQPIAVARGYKK